MFKIVRAPRAWWPVKFKLPGEDGQLVEHEFELRFRLLKVDEAIDFIAKASAAEETEDATDGAGRATMYANLVTEIADDWRGVQAENGTDLPWTADNLRLLMNETNMFVRVFRAFRDCLAGAAEIRAGN